jgi:HEAT repeat protein
VTLRGAALALAATLALALPSGAPAAAQGAGRGEAIADAGAVPALVARLADRVPQERSRAAYGLAELGTAAAEGIPALRAALGDEDPVVRYAAAWALSEIGPAADVARADLERSAREDPVGDVRWIAAKALRKLGHPDARPAPARHAGGAEPPAS